MDVNWIIYIDSEGDNACLKINGFGQHASSYALDFLWRSFSLFITHFEYMFGNDGASYGLDEGKLITPLQKAGFV